MRKSLLITLIAILAILIGFFAWFFISREEGEPLGEFVYDALPFGPSQEENIPFPNTEETLPGEDPGNEQNEEDGGVIVPAQKLFQISQTPVAGVGVFSRNSQSVVRYIERATGHIYEVLLSSGTSSSINKTRITNTTIPKIYEAYFSADGGAALTLSLVEDSDLVEANFLSINPPISSASSTDTFHTISSTPLRGNVGSVAVGSGNNAYYSLKDSGSITASTFSATNPRTLFSSPFTDWRLSSRGNSLLAYTKASAAAPGYAYSVNTSNGGLTKLLGPMNGLVAIMNSSGNRVAYSYVSGARTRLFTKPVSSSAEAVEIIPSTLAEKCIWSSLEAAVIFCGTPSSIGSSEPDNWYKGITNFSDSIWKFNTDTDVSEILAEPENLIDESLDVINPKLSPNENYLVFTNKIDLSLWALRIN